MINKKILIIDDEEPISDLLSYSLKNEGFITETASNGFTGIEMVTSFNPDMIILDLMLPDISGFDVCRKISQKSNIPIVMITAKSDTMDKILGIELGADDYITKPFNIREVTTRIKSIFRRIELITEKINYNNSSIIKLKNTIEICIDERKVLKNNIKINLTNKEFDLLVFLSQNKEKVFSRTQLLDKVWGFEYAGDTRTVDIHIQRLRKKLDKNKSNSIIETVFGVGYKIID